MFNYSGKLRIKRTGLKVMTWLLLTFLLTLPGFSQTPVSWNCNAKKISDRLYEVNIVATIQNGWHLYSQIQPAEAIAIPTTIKFVKHPLIKLSGKLTEIGKLEKHKEPGLDIEQWQYSDMVQFVQIITVKTNVKTNISGTIEYQVCTDEKCLPAKTVEFNIPLN